MNMNTINNRTPSPVTLMTSGQPQRILHSTDELSDGIEISQNPQSDALHIRQHAPRPAEQFALERSDSRNESENGK